jgi:hypothetical protein
MPLCARILDDKIGTRDAENEVLIAQRPSYPHLFFLPAFPKVEPIAWPGDSFPSTITLHRSAPFPPHSVGGSKAEWPDTPNLPIHRGLRTSEVAEWPLQAAQTTTSTQWNGERFARPVSSEWRWERGQWRTAASACTAWSR